MMELNQNNISTIVSMIVPFLSYLIVQIFGVTVDQAMLAMFLTAVIELVFLIWSAKNPNELGIFGNKKITSATEDGILNDEYVAGEDDGR